MKRCAGFLVALAGLTSSAAAEPVVIEMHALDQIVAGNYGRDRALLRRSLRDRTGDEASASDTTDQGTVEETVSLSDESGTSTATASASTSDGQASVFVFVARGKGVGYSGTVSTAE